MKARVLILALILSGCATYTPENLEIAASSPIDIPAIEQKANTISRPWLGQVSVDLSAPLTPDGVAAMAVVNNPDLAAQRVRAGVSDAQVFAASLWDSGVERAGDLVENIATFETARADTKDGLLDSAWDVDLSSERAVLASHGEGILRYLSGEWRRANRLVRSFLARPDQSLGETLAPAVTFRRTSLHPPALAGRRNP